VLDGGKALAAAVRGTLRHKGPYIRQIRCNPALLMRISDFRQQLDIPDLGFF